MNAYFDKSMLACILRGYPGCMATQKKSSKKAAPKKSDGNQTSDDKPTAGGLGSKSVTEVPEGQPTGSDSPYAG